MQLTGMALVLTLADQRLPSGGHVHSGGVEQAVADGVLHDLASLSALLSRRLAGPGLVGAALSAAAASAGTADQLAVLDAETDARSPSPAQREASRSMGRGLLRTARATWPAPGPGLAWTALGARPHHPVVLGCTCRAAGLDGAAAALVAAYLSVTGPATAAQRLLGLDPIQVSGVTIRLGPQIELVAARAAQSAAEDDPADLPDEGDVLLDVLTERHHRRADTLFAS